jgi:hypothetical protein
MRPGEKPVKNRSELIIERLPSKIDWTLHRNFSDRKDPTAEQQILSLAASAGISALNSATLPMLKGPYTTGRKLNVARYVQGEDRCMIRDVGRNDPMRQSGVRIFVQLSAINWETHKDILKRAVASMALAERIRSDGRPVEVIATWCVRGDADDRRCSMVWQPITDASARQLAELTDPSYFRTVVIGFYESARCEARKAGVIGSLAGYPVWNFAAFKSFVDALKQDGDIVVDWTRGTIQEQVENGLEQL